MLLLSMGGVTLAATTASADHDDSTDFKVPICHATGSESNLYENGRGEVPKWQIEGSVGHGGPHANHPNDIIPPFSAGSHGEQEWDAFPGLNWDAEGRAIWNDDCEAPDDDDVDVEVQLDLEGVSNCVRGNQWRVANESDEDVEFWFTVDGKTTRMTVEENDKTDVFTAKVPTLTIHWGGGDSGLQVGSDTEHAAKDESDCDGDDYDDDAEEVRLDLKGLSNCVPGTQWIVENDSDRDVIFWFTVDGKTTTMTVKADDKTAEFTVNVPTLTIHWGGRDNLDKGYDTEKAPTDRTDCSTPPNPTVVTAAVDFDDPTCPNLDGADVDFLTTEGIDYTIVGDVDLGGSVVVTATAEPGYVLAAGSPREFRHTFPSIEELDCDEVLPTEGADVCPNIPGVQRNVPKGYVIEDGECVEPEVKGTETANPSPNPPVDGPDALPTAVDAGIGGPTAGSGSTVALMAQLMMGAGLLFLIAAGWLQRGRQPRGVHQF